MISDLLKKIKEAVYGEEVRGSIHDAIEQCYKDATGHPDSVAAVVEGLVEETIERKAEVDTERKRIDNLLTNGTAQTAEIGRTILTTSPSGTSVAMKYLATDVVYDKMFNNIVSKDDDFITIPYPQQGYVAKLLKPGLYHMKFVARVNRTGGLPEIPMRLILQSAVNLDGDYETIKEDYFVFPATSSIFLYRNAEFTFAIKQPSYIKLLVTNITGGSGSFNFSAGDCQITAIDWVGKLCGSMPEVVDARIGVDGATYYDLGGAMRQQLKEINSQIKMTGIQKNLVHACCITNNANGVIATMTGHDYQISGTATINSSIIVATETVKNSSWIPGDTYYSYGHPLGACIYATTEDGTREKVEIKDNHEFLLPEGTASFDFELPISQGVNIYCSGMLRVYSDPLKNTLQKQIEDLGNKIDEMQKIITKIMASPRLIATENGGLQIKYDSKNEEG